jgi:hypothetical protein
MIRVLNKFEPNTYGGIEVDTTSRGSFKDLSPFYLGPYTWGEGSWDDDTYNEWTASNVENLWQYSKVYPEHVDVNGYLTPEWYKWWKEGMAQKRANRFPMGKGKRPLYSVWKGEKLDYISARKKIYIPAYKSLVLCTKSYALLYKWVMEGKDIVLRDFDGYDHVKMGMSLQDVIENPKRVMGHSFILYGLLTGQQAVLK